MSAKSLKKKEEGMQNRTISLKIGGKSTIEHKDEVQNQKGGKKMGCKIAQLTKDKGKISCNIFFRKNNCVEINHTDFNKL